MRAKKEKGREGKKIEAYRLKTGEFGRNRIGDSSFAKDRGGADVDLVDDGGLLRHAEPVLHGDLRFGHHIRAKHHLRRRRCCRIFRSPPPPPPPRQRESKADNRRGVRRVSKKFSPLRADRRSEFVLFRLQEKADHKMIEGIEKRSSIRGKRPFYIWGR